MNNKNNSLGFVSILTLIFIVLKLCKIIRGINYGKEKIL